MSQFQLGNSSDICRICLERKSDMFWIYDKYSDEFSEPIFCMIMYCASVKIEKGDGLPDSLCKFCKTRLETAYSFKRDCEQSDNKLRQSLKVDYSKYKSENNDSNNLDQIQNHTDNFSNNGNVKFEIEQETFHYGNNDSESEDPLYPNMYVMTEMRQSKSPEITTQESLDCTRGEFPCTFCCKKFDLKSNLLAHVWAMHNNNSNKNSTTIETKREVQSPPPEIASDDESFSNNESNQENDEDEDDDDEEYNDDDDEEFDPKTEDVPKTRYKKRRKAPARVKNETTSKTRRFICYVCSNTFHSEDELTAHAAESHPKQRYVCDQENCDQEFSEYMKYALHRKTDHLIENYLNCQECQRGYSNKRSLDRHIFNKHGPHECLHCSKRFRDVKTLEKHMTIHSKEYKCDTCNKSFSSSFRLSNHMRMHTNEKMHECDECGKKFNKKSNLDRHVDVHFPKGNCKRKGGKSISRREKNHLCPYCGQTFGRPVDLTTHIRIHTGVKPFSCDNCEYRCHDKQLLRSHIRIHTGDRPYKCSYCEKAFGTRGYLTIHERFHSGHRPYICSTCKKGFTNSKDLKVHERTHTGIKLFSCQICNNSFTTLHYLRVHTKKHETIV